MALKIFSGISLRHVARQYLASFGPRLEKTAYDFYQCPDPAHQDKQASFAVYDTHFHCYGCQQHGSHIELLALAGAISAASWPEQFNQATALLLNGQQWNIPTGHPAPETIKPLSKRFLQRSQRQLACARPYLEQRDLWPPPPEAKLGWMVRSLVLTQNGAKHWIRVPYVTIPYLWNNELYGMRLRRDDALFQPYFLNAFYDTYRPLVDEVAATHELSWPHDVRALMDLLVPRYSSIPGSRYGIYMARQLLQTPATVCVTEGEFDALLLIQHGLPAVAVKPGGYDFNLRLARWFSYVGTIWIIADNDKAGQLYAHKLHTILGSNSRVIFPPAGKDVTDAYQQIGLAWLQTAMKANHHER